MDWATFIKDNSQSLFTLGGVFLGSVITFLISYLNNRFEAGERDKDRDEKRRDAKIQAIENSIGRDIDKVMDLLASLINILSERENTKFRMDVLEERRKVTEAMTEDEYRKEANLLFESIVRENRETRTLLDSIGGLVFSFDDEISSQYEAFLVSILSILSADAKQTEEATEVRHMIIEAGMLQRLLREKKISLIDSLNLKQ